MGWHQTKKLLESKGNNKVKEQSPEWEKILENLMSDKELISKTCKEFKQPNSTKTAQLENGQRIWANIPPKNPYQWPIIMCKNVQHR